MLEFIQHNSFVIGMVLTSFIWLLRLENKTNANEKQLNILATTLGVSSKEIAGIATDIAEIKTDIKWLKDERTIH